MIYKPFQDKKISLLGFGAMRLPQKADGTIDEEQLRNYAARRGLTEEEARKLLSRNVMAK